jgi:hypothetical protein
MFEFLAGLLAGMMAVGSIWFWLLVFAVLIGITVLVETEEGGWATFTLVVSVILMNWVFKVGIIQALWAHPWKALGWVLVYFVLGIAWGLVKWFVFVHKRAGLYRDARDAFLKQHRATELTPALAAELMEELNHNFRSYQTEVSALPPKASEHKGDIIRWMSYWPFSVVGTLLNDVVRKAWRHIYDLMTQTYDRVAAHVFRKYSADVALAKQHNTPPILPKMDESDTRRR